MGHGFRSSGVPQQWDTVFAVLVSRNTERHRKVGHSLLRAYLGHGFRSSGVP